MAIFTTPVTDSFGTGTGDRIKVGSEWDNTDDAQASVARYEPILTTDQLVERYLFGIPLVAALPDPVTKKRAVYTPTMLKDAIMRACSTVEAEAGVHVTPVEVNRRLPFDRAEYRALGYFRVPDVPILRITSLQVRTADGTPVYNVPLNWVDPANFKKGQINIIPLMPAFIGQGGTLPSFDAGGSAWLAILGQAGWVPGYWQMVYIVGMDEGHIPMVINELIGIVAAIDILGKLAATYRIASYSTGLDAASQSVSGPGPALYDAAIQRLQDEKKAKMGKVKAMYYRKLFSDNV